MKRKKKHKKENTFKKIEQNDVRKKINSKRTLQKKYKTEKRRGKEKIEKKAKKKGEGLGGKIGKRDAETISWKREV